MDNLVFDITSEDAAYDYALKFTGMTGQELINTYVLDSDSNIDIFWNRYFDRFNAVCFDNINVAGFHVTGSLDDCNEIKTNGIFNLQYVLSHDTMLARELKKYGISFDISNRIMYVANVPYSVDYYSYDDVDYRDGLEGKLKSIGHRLYYDYCVDGFLCDKDVKRYGTDIHRRPEFILKLIDFNKDIEKLDKYWKDNSKGYKVYFKVGLEQIHKFTFFSEDNNEPYSEDEILVLKKKFLAMALSVAFDDGLSQQIIYIRDDEYIRPEQITKCELID